MNVIVVENPIIQSVKILGIKAKKLKDPIDVILKKWKRPNNLLIKRVSIPLGVVGVIFESRPNVASDISSLCFKSGNAVILRGGSEALNSNKILVSLFRKALKKNKIEFELIEPNSRKILKKSYSNNFTK